MTKDHTGFASKGIRSLQLLFTLTLLLISQSALAESQIFDTPYFSIPLTKTMQQIASDDGKIDNYLQHMYVYGQSDENIESSITINVIPLAKGESNMDAKQQQLIAGMIHGIENKDQSGSTANKFDPKDKIQTVKLKNREFKSYTLNFQEGVMKIYTTINKNNMYSFVIACYGKNADMLNKQLKLLTDEISQVQLK